MYKISDKYYINPNNVAKMNILTELSGKERYFITLTDGTRHEILSKEVFDEIAEASQNTTYADLIVTDKLSVGDIEDVEAEINKIKDYSDVKDVVGTYADLMTYDTSTLNLNDVIEVLSDENEDNANTMYKWNGTKFNLIGRLGPFYTKEESDSRYPTSVQYDSTNKKITQTKNNTISDIVTASTLKTDMELNNVVNTGDSDTPVSGGTTKFTTGGAYIELDKKVDKEPGKGLSTNDYVTVDKEYLDNLRTTLPNVNDTTIALTYSQIKTLKDNNQLIAGRTYRITDYSTMTIDTETRSAGNDFDIILKANTTNSFEPICSAHVRTGTNYFTQSYVSQWILWYNFDNDTNLCSWVDNTCKGYIYRMIDEYNNDLPYDFKNIQFKRYKIATTTYNTYSNLVGMYLGNTSPYGYTIDSNDFVWRYTFVCSDALDEDLSNKHIEIGEFNTCRYVKQIKIGTRLADSPYRSKLQLNNNVFISGNIMCDMTFGNQTHINTIQVVNDISYNYFGSMMRRNLIYVTDFNHNNIRECFEDNLIGSGTQMFSWNWVGDHCANNIIQGMTLVYCLGYLRYVRADSSNLTFNNVQINETYAGADSNPYSVYITNAIEGASADIRTSKFGTLQKLKLDHSAMAMIDILYILYLTVTGRPIYNVVSNRIEYTEIYFNEAVSAVSGWEFKDCRGSSSSYLTIDFRDTSDILVNNAIKTYERQIYSVDGTLTGYSGVLSYKVYDTTNNFDTVYIWSAMLDDLTPTANIIAKDLTRHEIVNRVDSNYEIVDNILINAIDKIDPTKDYEVNNHTNELAYQITAPSGAKLLQLQAIGGNTVKYSPSVASDSTKAMIKTMPSTVYTFDGDKFKGDSKVSENLITPNTFNSTVSTFSFENGVLTSSGVDGQTYSYANCQFKLYLSAGSYILKFFNSTIVGSDYNGISISESGTQGDYGIKNALYSSGSYSLTISTSGYYGIRLKFQGSTMPMLVSGTTAPTTFVKGFDNIHNLELSGLKVEGENILGIVNKTQTTTSGITYKVENGSLYLNGTAETGLNLYFDIDELYLNGTFYYKEFTSGTLGTWARALRYGETNIQNLSNPLNFTISNETVNTILVYIPTGSTFTNAIITPMLVRGSTAPTSYVPYIAPTTIPINLTSIEDSGGNKLFADGKLRENDYITPYKASKGRKNTTITNSSNIFSWDGYWYLEATNFNGFKALGTIKATKDYFNNRLESNGNLKTTLTTSYTATQVRELIVGAEIEYPLATPIEVSIDWSATLRNIQGYPNGSIIAENTNNMDVESVITYNSIIQETLCPSVTVDGANRFDKSTVLNRTYIHSDGTLRTETTDGWITSDYIEIGSAVSYNFNTVQMRYRLLDESKNYIANSYNTSTSASGTITNSVNASYIQICIRLVDKDTFMVVKGSTVPTSYRPYKASITRNLPTQASDGWSAGTQRNYRVFSDYEGNAVNKREMNVSKESNLGDKTWQLYSGNTFLTYRSGITGISTASIVPLLTTDYNTVTTDFGSINDKEITSRGGGALYVAIRDDLYSSYTEFKTSLTNKPLYYELVDASKTETDMDDFDYFFDVEEGDVITFNNPYAQQVYATYSFLIESEEI